MKNPKKVAGRALMKRPPYGKMKVLRMGVPPEGAKDTRGSTL